jgi:Phosphotransferase enzyme family
VVIVVDPLAVEEWIRANAEPVGAIETVHERPWATVLRVPLAGGVAWFKACAPVQAFEPRLTAELFVRWPDRLPAGYEELLALDLPLEREEARQLRDFAPRFTELCGELAAYGVPETIQHDDLHHANLYAHGGRVRVLDWGDASISHPFASLVVTFRFLEERTKLAPGDPWFARLRDAYLEPWGRDFGDAFALAVRVGTFARPIAYLPQRAALPAQERRLFDTDFSVVLRRAVAQTLG